MFTTKYVLLSAKNSVLFMFYSNSFRQELAILEQILLFMYEMQMKVC